MLRQPILWGGLAVMLVVALPRLLLGQGSYIPIHDVLDNEFMYRVHIARHCAWLDYDCVLPNVMNGLPRAFMVSSLNVTMVLFYLLSPFVAFALNEALVHGIGFVGMALLLSHHILPADPARARIALGVSACFALLPLVSIHGLTIAGQPLALWAFLNLRSRRLVGPSLALVALLPLYWAAHLSGVFFLSLLGLWWLWESGRTRRPHWLFLGGLCLMAAGFGLVEFKLLEVTLFGTTPSHRSAWDAHSPAMNRTLGQSAARFWDNLRFGQYHAPSLHLPILGATLATCVLGAFRVVSGPRLKRILQLLALAVALSAVYGLAQYRGLVPLKETVPVLKVLKVERYHWLHPSVWYVLFALILSVWSDHRLGRRLQPWLLGAQLAVVLLGIPAIGRLPGQAMYILKPNYALLLGRPPPEADGIVPYERVFSARLFRRIRNAIGRDPSTYRVVSLGLHPFIAQFNGFYTLDSYQNNYPLAHKRRFRRVIAAELDKSPALAAYYDHWGSRCYLFAAELGRDVFIVKSEQRAIDHLALDTEALHRMGGEYILSAVRIRNAGDQDLRWQQTFDDRSSPWRIYLYQVL